jgi:hypothetical protein
MFNINLEMCQMTYEIYVDQQLVTRQMSNAPVMVHKSQYIDLINQLSGDKRPMRFKIIKPDVIWDEFEQKRKTIDNYIEYRNIPYINKYGRE